MIKPEEFEALTTSKGGIAKLRQLILDLAVRGLLVPQDPNDEPASVLIEKIRSEKQQLLEEGKIRKSVGYKSVESSDFVLPIGWELVYLESILGLITDGDHQPPPKAIDGIPFLVIGNLNQSKINMENCRFVPCEYYKSLDWGRKPSHGDILYTVTGSYGIPIPVDTDKEFCVQRHVAILKATKSSPKDYLKYVLGSNIALEYATKIATGIAQKTVPLTGLRKMPILLPPLEEQKRIVKKVDELMEFCDRLEKKQLHSRKVHQALLDTLLANLVAAEDNATFQTVWAQIAANFAILFSTEADVDRLKQVILDLAVRGKLGTNNRNDEPASVLLTKIAEEKARLVAEGKIKKSAPLPKISDSEMPFVLPKGWECVRLGDLLSKIGAGSTPLGGKKVYVDDGVKFLRSQNVWNDGLRLDDVAFISEAIHEKMQATEVCPGDLLFNITGASIGRCALVPDSFDTGNVSQHVTIIRPITSQIKTYLHKVLVSPLIQQTVMDVQVGVSREGLSISKLGKFVIAIPPLAEQHRIVAKVDELMVCCDRIKEKIRHANNIQEHLATAIVEKAVA